MNKLRLSHWLNGWDTRKASISGDYSDVERRAKLAFVDIDVATPEQRRQLWGDDYDLFRCRKRRLPRTPPLRSTRSATSRRIP
jgi:hypothetical protein